MNPFLLPLIALTLYLASGSLLARRLARGTKASETSRMMPLGLGFLAVFLHGLDLRAAIFLGDGLSLGFFNVLSLVTALVALLLLIAALSRPVENLGIAILPLAGLTTVLRAVLGEGAHATPLGPELQLHILLSMLAYSLLAIGAVQAILLAVQNHYLRSRQPGGFIRALPPLDTMESLLFQIIAVGYFLLGFSLLSGLLFLEDIFAQHLVHKTVLSLVAWIVFSVLLWGRWHFGWRGRKAVRWTLGGFVALMMAYFGSKLVLELVLGT